jgi:hypothetical protein
LKGAGANLYINQIFGGPLCGPENSTSRQLAAFESKPAWLFSRAQLSPHQQPRTETSLAFTNLAEAA